MALSRLQKIALDCLGRLERRMDEYADVNSCIRKLQGDFPSYIQLADEKVQEDYVKILNFILEPESADIGEGIASYWLYETGRRVVVDGKDYDISTIKLLQEYLESTQPSEAAHD